MDSLPAAVAMSGGQLGDRRQRVGAKPPRVEGAAAFLERAVEDRRRIVGAQVAVPLEVPARHAGVQVEVGAAYQLQHLAIVTCPRRPVASQRTAYPGRLGVPARSAHASAPKLLAWRIRSANASSSASCGRSRSLRRPRRRGRRTAAAAPPRGGERRARASGRRQSRARAGRRTGGPAPGPRRRRRAALPGRGHPGPNSGGTPWGSPPPCAGLHTRHPPGPRHADTRP